jgi:dTDP-4-dehydrorhamnose 3,5-epimerase
MTFIPTEIPGLVLFQPLIIPDERGYFYESYNRKTWESGGVFADFVQDNQAKSTRGVLRGLHYQTGDFAQAKLVRVIEGEVLDVVVDIRPGAPTFGKTYSVVLSEANKLQLFIPRGFAHGYLVLTETATFSYKCDNFYAKTHEGGIRFDDPTLGIDWDFDPGRLILSDKDLQLPYFGNHLPVF